MAGKPPLNLGSMLSSAQARKTLLPEAPMGGRVPGAVEPRIRIDYASTYVDARGSSINVMGPRQGSSDEGVERTDLIGIVMEPDQSWRPPWEPQTEQSRWSRGDLLLFDPMRRVGPVFSAPVLSLMDAAVCPWDYADRERDLGSNLAAMVDQLSRLRLLADQGDIGGALAALVEILSRQQLKQTRRGFLFPRPLNVPGLLVAEIHNRRAPDTESIGIKISIEYHCIDWAPRK